MTSNESKIIQWKKLYQLTSGTFYNENEDVVRKKLLSVAKEIETGLSAFKKPSSDASEKLEKLLKEKRQEKLIPFTQKLYQFLDLEVNQSYEILCYYLVNEYRGSANSLQNFVSSESLMIKLLNDIWSYYSLERMVLLKVTKCIVEFHVSADHPYRDAFKAVIEQIGFGKLRSSYIDQFESLVKDVQQVKFHSGDIFNSSQKLTAWSERKHREMNEILQIIAMTCHFERIKPDELVKLVELFRLHSFGKQNQFLSPTSELVQKVTYSEITLLMISLSTTSLDSFEWMTQVVEKLDELIIAMHHYPEHGPILLSWMLFKFAAKSNDATTDHYASYGKLGSRAVQLNVFDFLHKMVTSRMFKDNSLVAKITARCIYDNLSFLCELFNSDGSVSTHPKVFELFSEVLKSPAIAKDFCKSEDNPIRGLMNSGLEKFPFDFTPLLIVSQSLATASKASHKWILEFLQTLPVYTEQPTDPMYELKKVYDGDEEDAYVLLNDYRPFRKIDEFFIPAGTRAVAREDKNKMFVYFLIETNFFHVLLNEINEILSSILNFSEINESRLEAGVKFLATVIRRFESPNDLTNEMVAPTEMVFEILSKFKTFQTPSLGLMASCVDVCTELLQYFGDEVFHRFMNLNIAPSVTATHQDFKAYASGVGFESGLVGFYLINFERASGRYNFLKSYLNFLKRYTKLKKENVSSVELPGLIFILREILVHAHTWRFESEQDKMEIFIFVFEYLHDILTIPSDVIKGDPWRKLLRNVCLYSLLNLEPAMALLKHVAIGNPALLNNFVENETNWFTATDSNLNLLVLNAMRILMQILRLKEPNEQLTPLEQLIYTQPKQRDTLKLIPIVTNYTTYPFNRRFAVLSCRLLRRFAIEFQSSLSACLDMEADQIRMMFLQRLRDDLESEDLKIAVLDLVNACIDKQPGLTEAFFKVTYEQDQRNKFFIKGTKESESSSDGIITYMEEYLAAIAKDPSRTRNEQLKRIMSLFHALWKQGLQSLVKDLIKKENFWPSLCSPLLASPITSYQYSQLFNILGLELFKIRENEIEENFKKVLTKFLEKNAFERWLEVVFELPTMDFDDSTIVDDTPEWLSRLQSFKDFLVLLLRKKSAVQIPSESSKILLDRCLDALVKSSEDLESGADTRPFVVLSELYLILINDQQVKFTKTPEEDAKLLKQVEILLKTITNCYTDLHKRAKDSVLAILIKVLDIESDEIQASSDVALSFVRYNVEILCQEFSTIESQKDFDEPGRNFTFVLAITLLKKLVLLNDSGEFIRDWSHWFNHHKIFNRLMSVVNLICQDFIKRFITAELLDLLVLFAKGGNSKELLNCEIGEYLWMKLMPPKEMLERSMGGIEIRKDAWTPQDWWIIYTKGIQLVKLLLQRHSHLFIKDALFFVGIHEEFLVDCIMLAKTSLEPNAMKLIKITLELMSEVIAFESIWRIDYFQSVMNLMKCIQSLLDTSVSLLHRPKILKRLSEASKTQLEEYSDTILTDPSDELVNSMDQLIDIITLCSKCLLQFSPKLLNLLCDVEFQQNKWIPFIEVQFGAPKINADAFQQLSFGTILSAIGLFVKILNLQHFAFKQIPLNQLPTDDDHDGSDSVSMISSSEHQRAMGSSSPLSPRRPFSKSLSTNSVTSSIVQASNELLSHLDVKTCLAALEFMLTLLASQSLLALKNQQLSSREKQLIRRELSNELYCFHDFVKKRILKDASKSVFCRQKLGAYLIVNNVDDDGDSQPGPSRTATQRRSQDLRVNVVRKLHLQQKTSSPFEIPSSFSPIPATQSRDHIPIDTTPLRSTGNPTSSTAVGKRVGFDLTSTGNKVSVQEDDEPFVVNRGDPSFTGLSVVKMVEEDYLHMLSNLFMFICQNEN